MTSTAPARTEHVGRGAILALLIIPVGVVVFVLISSIGIYASIVSFGVAFGAYWLYQRGAGGVISRTGAWVVLAIVVVTVLLSIYADLVWGFATGVPGYSQWEVIGQPGFWPQFNDKFFSLLSEDSLNVILILAFGLLGSARILRNAFRRTSTRPAAAYPPVASPSGSTATQTPTTYRNDVDAPPTGSADDKTAPPTSGV